MGRGVRVRREDCIVGKIKHIHIVMAVAIMALGLSGCGRAADDTAHDVATTEDTSESEEVEITYPVTLRVGYSTNEEDPRGVALAKFKKDVESATGGDIMVEIYPSGELGSDAELIAGMITGDVDMTVSSAGNYALYATKIGVSALPFLFDDFEDAWEFIDSEPIQNINEDLEDYNMHVLAYFDNGFRCVTTSEDVGAVTGVAKMEGLNIRTPDNQIVMETMSELGANPKSFPFADLPEALKNGTFDAQENPIPVIYNNKLYEVQKYLSITNHSYDAMPLTIRNDIWKQLTPEYQEILNVAAGKAQDYNRQLVKQQTSDYVEKLEEEGMIVNTPDLGPFKEATEGVTYVFSNVYGEELIDYVKKVQGE